MYAPEFKFLNQPTLLMKHTIIVGVSKISDVMS